MIKIFKYLKTKEWMLILVSVLFIVTQVWLDLKLPDYMSDITTYTQTPGSEMSQIWEAGSYMLLCALGSLAASVIVGFFAARVAASFSARLRSLLFEKVESFSMEEINRFSTASLITRSTNDITQIQMIIAIGLQVLIKAPILAVWAIVKISGKSWQWTSATGFAVLFLLVMIAIIGSLTLPKFKRIQSLTDNLNRVSRENLTGLRVIRAYNAENYQEEKFEGANEELTKTNLFTNRMMASFMPTMMLIMSGLSLAVYWIGAYLINEAGMMDKISLFSDMVVFSSYAMQVIMAFIMLTVVFILLPRAAVAAGRVNEVLSTPLSILDGEMGECGFGHKGKVEFRNVSFKYPDSNEYVLKNISFTANPGETVAFIGATGCGKSSLINLIPRFYDATIGEVLVNDMNVKDYKVKNLHNKLGLVPQRNILFSGDVTSNVAYGNNGKGPISEAEVKRAVAIAQGTDFVERMDGQYKAHIAQGGSNLSGGQKQRMTIARAISRNPEIYLFDDSFSALDYRTDRMLRAALKEETSGATSLIVAQRIGTIMDADKIIVLDEGKMVGCGKHEELLRSCKVYQEIAYSQLSKEELENAQ
ncbi:multidrug ABC transporter ATP-binding protein [Bacillus sp. FJAT-27916]|uniref:ABC transporter ATP-binding protein n=1 Tax=Bacillaceae TaxID=186817 RepID=UPI0006718068|nr:ABC transporter ATP-binding protein [Bacillus sp. FJAT-27916]KMY45535.1 multidrug ABC transporter ATP-binding protein [Bacillus sp. FJAT-27916]